jgi:hypothetical protein
MTIYLGLDPGKTTGVAWCSYREKKLVIHDFAEIKWPEFRNWTRTWWNTYDKLTDSVHDENVIVVCEDFILRKSGNWTPTPVTKQIGYLYSRADDLGWTFTLQQPMIKPAGYRMGKIPKPDTHWKDALAHAVYAIHQGVDPVQTIIW